MLLLVACVASPVDSGPGGRGDDTDGGKDTTEDTAGRTDPLEVLATLDVPLARWGVSPPNNLKVYPTAWDPVAGRLYVSGMELPAVMSMDPAVGHPDTGFELPISGFHPPLLVADPDRRVLYWVGRDKGGLVALDLDDFSVIGRNPASFDTDSDVANTSIVDAAVDPTTGVLWLDDLPHNKIFSVPSGCTGDAVEISGPSMPAGLGVSPAGDLLYYYDSADSTVYSYQPSTGARLPFATVGTAEYARISVAEDGSVVVTATELSVYEPDGTLRWTVDNPGSPKDLAVVGDTVALTVEESVKDVGTESNADVHVYRLADGTSAVVAARFGAELMSTDPAGNRIFVSNESDGTVTVIDATTWTNTGDLPVSNAPDTSAYDPVTNTRYVLDRLGGSKIHAWSADGSLRDFDGGAWPTELAVDVDRRRLYAPRHFEAQIGVWDLDSGEELAPIELGVLASTSDTLGDFDFEPDSGQAVVVYTETGSITLVDLIAGSVTWTHADADLAAGPAAGAGEAFVALDAPNDRMYLYQRDPLALKAISLSDSYPKAVAEPLDSPKSYNLNAIYLDPEDARLYVGQSVYSVPDLEPVRVDELPWRVLCRIDDVLYAVDADQEGKETLRQLDHETGEERASWPLGKTLGMRLESTCDPEHRTLTVSSLEEATVTVYALP